MTFKEIQELMRLINKLELTEFKMKDGEFELAVRTKNYEKFKQQPLQMPAQPVMQMPAPVAAPPAAPAAAPATPAAPKAEPAAPQQDAAAGNAESNYLPIKSPIVGTFYRSSSPDKPAYVKVGDRVEAGNTVCIVEAMKLFNEIESEISGKIVKVLVEDAQPVEYDQVLFLVDPKG